MNFHRDLAYSKIAGYLFVHLPGYYQHHHLLFPWGQCFEPLPRQRSTFIGSPALSIAFDGRHHSITTERSTLPSCILWNASSMPSRPMRSETNFSSGNRPCR